MTKMTSVLDYPPEQLQKYLVETGQTLEEVKASLKASQDAARVILNNTDEPVMSGKFSDPLGFDIEE